MFRVRAKAHAQLNGLVIPIVTKALVIQTKIIHNHKNLLYQKINPDTKRLHANALIYYTIWCHPSIRFRTPNKFIII